MKIDLKKSGLDKVLDSLKEMDKNIIAGRTVNKIAAQSKTAASKSIRERYNIKAKTINKYVLLKRAGRGETTAYIIARKYKGSIVNHIPLLKMGARQVKRGVSVAIRKGQRKVIKSAFVSKMKSGHEAVFIRSSKKQLPIREVTGPAVADLMDDKKVKYVMWQVGKNNAERLLRHEIGHYFTSRLKRKISLVNKILKK